MFSNRRSDWYRRPETLSSHREDQQPNEPPVRRRVVAPPTLLSTSLPKPHGYYGQGMDISRGRGRGYGSRGGWTQVARRGKKHWQGGYGSGRGGGWRRNDMVQSFDSPGASTSHNSIVEHAQPLFTTRPHITKRSASPTGRSPSREDTPRASIGHFETHVAEPAKFTTTPLVTKRSASSTGSSSSREDTPGASIGQYESRAVEHARFKPPLPRRPKPQGNFTIALPTPDPLSHTQPAALPTSALVSPRTTRSPSRPVTPSKSPTPPFKRQKVDHHLRPRIKIEEIGDQELPTAASIPQLERHVSPPGDPLPRPDTLGTSIRQYESRIVEPAKFKPPSPIKIGEIEGQERPSAGPLPPLKRYVLPSVDSLPRPDTLGSSIRQYESRAVESAKFRPPLPRRPRPQGVQTITPDTPSHTPPTALPVPVPVPPRAINSPPRPVTPSRSPTPPFKCQKSDHTPDLRPRTKIEEIEGQQPPSAAPLPPLKQYVSPPGGPLPRPDTLGSSIRQYESRTVEASKFKPPLPRRPRNPIISLASPDLPSHTSPTALPVPPHVTNSPPRPVTPSRSPTPPFKRQKVDHTPDLRPRIKIEEIEDHELPSATSLPPLPPIKREVLSLSPPAPLGRRLVTESCSFYPLPKNCHKSHPDYKQNRHALFSREYNILKSLDLKKTKVLFREDGMVIEWKSSTPVWSDTLRPEPSNLSAMLDAALRANSKSAASKSKNTTPRRSASRGVNQRLSLGADNSSPSTRLPSPRTRGELPTHKDVSSPAPLLPRRRPLPLPVPKPKSAIKSNHSTDAPIAATDFKPEADPPNEGSEQGPVSQPVQPAATGTPRKAWVAEDLAEVEPMAIAYLQRYIRTFDTDRAQLDGGYAEDAILSVRVSRSAEATPAQAEGAPRESDAQFAQGRGAIGGALRSLGTHKFCPRGVAGKVVYDVVSLDVEAGGGILLTVHGEMADEPPDTSVSTSAGSDGFSVTQSFVLQRGWGVDGTETWPLQATSHQMVLRQIGSTGPGLFSMVETTPLEDEFPWLP